MTSGGAAATTNDLILGRREAASKDGERGGANPGFP